MRDRRTVLYAGGTGTISASCVRASVEGGADVFVLNRGRSASLRPLTRGYHEAAGVFAALAPSAARQPA